MLRAGDLQGIQVQPQAASASCTHHRDVLVVYRWVLLATPRAVLRPRKNDKAKEENTRKRGVGRVKTGRGEANKPMAKEAQRRWVVQQ